MSSWDTVFPLLALAGGIALFLLGTEVLVDGLQKAAGARAREMLTRLTSGRIRAALGGVGVSSLIHSGPTTVIVLGYVSAGILSLSQSIPLIFGANIGTTLSMQIVAFNVGQLCFGVIAIGVLLRRIGGANTMGSVGNAIGGFGLLFLGLETMKGALAPLRGHPGFEATVGLLHADTGTGYFLAFLVGTAITALFQSSGVIISMMFSLAALGVLDDYRIAVPFILGAHVGTCIMTFLAAVGGSATVWRVAVAHLLFNLVGAVLATLMLPLYDLLIRGTAEDLTRQVANFNTAKQVISVVVLLPFTGIFERAVLRLTKGLGPPVDERSHLDPQFLAKPESAILAVTRELRRQAAMVDSMLRLSLDGLVSLDLRRFQPVTVQERAVDVIRYQIQAYIARIAEHQISHRQALMLQQLVITSNAIERIGDHVEDIGYLCRTKVRGDVWFPDEHMHRLLELGSLVREMFQSAMRALDPTIAESHELGAEVLAQRSRYKKRSRELKVLVQESLSEPGQVANRLFFLRYLMILDKIVSHLKAMAKEEARESWAVEEVQLDRVEPLVPRPPGRPPQHPMHNTFEAAIRDISQREREEAEQKKQEAAPPPDDESEPGEAAR